MNLSDPLPTMVRAASWTTGLGWTTLLAGFLQAAFSSGPPAPSLPAGAAALLLLFVGALIAAVLGGVRQSPHQRGPAWLAAGMAFTGAASSVALLMLARLIESAQ